MTRYFNEHILSFKDMAEKCVMCYGLHRHEEDKVS